MRTKLIAAIALTAGALAAPALAHHSFAMFDNTKTLRLSGVIREFQWTNPHTWLQLKVSKPGGQDEEWSIEHTSPNYLRRDGWTKDSLKPGDRVVVVVHPLRSGKRGGALRSVTFADGRPVGSKR